jgi:hypothetical protein
MNNKQLRLAERRESLLAQTTAQRDTVTQIIAPWRIPLSMVDQGLAALRVISVHPLWMVGGMTMLSVIGRGRVGIWLWRSLVTWRIVHELRSK